MNVVFSKMKEPTGNPACGWTRPRRWPGQDTLSRTDDELSVLRECHEQHVDEPSPPVCRRL